LLLVELEFISSKDIVNWLDDPRVMANIKGTVFTLYACLEHEVWYLHAYIVRTNTVSKSITE
jgi:hypothetical protein